MTKATKQTIIYLMQGYNIAKAGRNGYRLRNEAQMPVRKITTALFENLRKVLRKDKNGLYVLNKKTVRSMHGNSFLKRTYKQHRKGLLQLQDATKPFCRMCGAAPGEACRLPEDKACWITRRPVPDQPDPSNQLLLF